MHDAPLRWLWYCSSIVALALAVSACGGDDREEGSTQTDTGPDVQEVVEDTSPGLDCDATPTAPGCVEPPAAALCSECNVDGDCGPSGKCIADARGTTFCSRQCGYFGDTQCPAEYYCRQFGNAATDLDTLVALMRRFKPHVEAESIDYAHCASLANEDTRARNQEFIIVGRST